MDNSLICEQILLKEIFHLRSNEIQKMICMSKVRIDKKHVSFENSNKIRVHQSRCESYLSWKEAVRVREIFK